MRTTRNSQTTRRGVELRLVGDNDEGLGALPVGQQHVVDPGVDGGDLGAEVTPDALNLGMHETPHSEEHADPGEHRGDHVLVHREQCTSEERRSAERRSSGLVRSPETLPGAAV